MSPLLFFPNMERLSGCSQVNRSYGFTVEKLCLQTMPERGCFEPGVTVTIAGGTQTGWRDGVGTDAHFLGGVSADAEDPSVYCEAALSSDGLSLLVYDSLIRQVKLVSRVVTTIRWEKPRSHRLAMAVAADQTTYITYEHLRSFPFTYNGIGQLTSNAALNSARPLCRLDRGAARCTYTLTRGADLYHDASVSRVSTPTPSSIYGSRVTASTDGIHAYVYAGMVSRGVKRVHTTRGSVSEVEGTSLLREEASPKALALQQRALCAQCEMSDVLFVTVNSPIVRPNVQELIVKVDVAHSTVAVVAGGGRAARIAGQQWNDPRGIPLYGFFDLTVHDDTTLYVLTSLDTSSSSSGVPNHIIKADVSSLSVNNLAQAECLWSQSNAASDFAGCRQALAFNEKYDIDLQTERACDRRCRVVAHNGAEALYLLSAASDIWVFDTSSGAATRVFQNLRPNYARPEFAMATDLVLGVNQSKLFVVDRGNRRICQVELANMSVTVTELDASPVRGFSDGATLTATESVFEYPWGAGSLRDGKALLLTDFGGLRLLNLEDRPEFEATLHEQLTPRNSRRCPTEDGLVEGNISTANFTVTFHEDVEISALLVYDSVITGARAVHVRHRASEAATSALARTSSMSATSDGGANYAAVSFPLAVGRRIELDAPTRGRVFNFVLEGFENLPSGSTVKVQVLACAATTRCTGELLLEGTANASDFTVDFGEAVQIGRVVMYGVNASTVRMQSAPDATTSDLTNNANFFTPVLAYEIPSAHPGESASAFFAQYPVMGEGTPSPPKTAGNGATVMNDSVCRRFRIL